MLFNYTLVKYLSIHTILQKTTKFHLFIISNLIQKMTVQLWTRPGWSSPSSLVTTKLDKSTMNNAKAYFYKKLNFRKYTKKKPPLDFAWNTFFQYQLTFLNFDIEQKMFSFISTYLAALNVTSNVIFSR